MPKTLTINTEENDDWMKALPGYKDEVAIHENLAKKYKKNTGKVVRKGFPIKIDINTSPLLN